MMMISALQPSPQRTKFEIFKELPRDILCPTIFDYCTGKSLSTLALAFATSGVPVYEKLALTAIPDFARHLLLQIGKDIESTAVDTHKCGGAVRWIRVIADEGYEDVESLSSMKRICRVMRHLSENLALVDFLHQSMMDSEYRGKWEWPVWVGPISIKLSSNVFDPATELQVVITSPLDYPSYIPGAHSVWRDLVVERVFRLEMMNLVPLPPWGQVRGICANDEVKIKKIYTEMPEEDDRLISLPIYSIYSLPGALNVKLLTRSQARRRYERIPYRYGRPPSSLWLLHDEPPQIALRDRLLCCWSKDDSSDVFQPREYMDYFIKLMNIRHRMVQEPLDETHMDSFTVLE
jgi:hypothetical protein